MQDFKKFCRMSLLSLYKYKNENLLNSQFSSVYFQLAYIYKISLSFAVFREFIVQFSREFNMPIKPGHYSLRIIEYNCRPERVSIRERGDGEKNK